MHLTQTTWEGQETPWGNHGDTEAFYAHLQNLGAARDEQFYRRRLELARNAGARHTATQSQADELAPRTWDDYIGQTNLKLHMQVRIASAKNRNAPLPHTLLVANPGAGKTTIVELIAQELGVPLATLTKPTQPDRVADVLFRFGGERGILFVDEVHEWTARQHHALMQLTESGELDANHGTYPFPEVTVIAATTEPQDLPVPLRDRFMIQPRWVPYTHPEMVEIIRRMAARANIPASDDLVETLAAAAADSPRQARALTVAARDMVAAGITPTGIQVLQFTETELDGLTRRHLDYLHTLGRQQNGKAGQETMSTLLGVNRRESRDLERLLTARGYIEITGTGRQVTAAGRRRIEAGSLT